MTCNHHRLIDPVFNWPDLIPHCFILIQKLQLFCFENIINFSVFENWKSLFLYEFFHEFYEIILKDFALS